MASLTARLLRRGVRTMQKPKAVGDDFVGASRRRINRAVPTFPTRGVTRRPATPAELGSLRAEWVGAPDARRRILYLHGGYYLAGRPQNYRSVAARLAVDLHAEVLLLDYRLAPEHPHPAAVDDAFDAYEHLLALGTAADAIAVAGDSAGGGLTLALLHRLRARQVAMPAAAVLLSPWVDLTCQAPSIDHNDARDDMLSAALLRAAATAYAGSHDVNDPEISPLFGDLGGLPPLFITVDESEMLLDDARRLAQRATAAGTQVELREATGTFHIWPIMVPLLPEARATVAEIVTFLDRTLA